MKLLFCKTCSDVIRITMDKIKYCDCGQTYGQYEEDGINAWFKGPAIPLGFANRSFLAALQNQPNEHWGKKFEAFVIEKRCPTFEDRNEFSNLRHSHGKD